MCQQQITSACKAMASAPNMAAQWRQCTRSITIMKSMGEDMGRLWVKNYLMFVGRYTIPLLPLTIDKFRDATFPGNFWISGFFQKEGSFFFYFLLQSMTISTQYSIKHRNNVCRNMWKYPLKYAPEHTIPHWKTKKLHTVDTPLPHPPPSVASLPRRRFSGNLECSLWHLWIILCPPLTINNLLWLRHGENEVYTEGALGGSNTPPPPFGSNFVSLACQRGWYHVWGYPFPVSGLTYSPPPPPCSVTFSGLVWHHSLHLIVKHLPWINLVYATGEKYTYCINSFSFHSILLLKVPYLH